MGVYAIKVEGIATGASANTFKTLLGLKLANTAGHVARLRRLVVGGGGGAAQDLQVSIRLRRTDNNADGTSTAVNVNTIGKHESEQIASVVSAIGKNYTVEPTNYETEMLGGGALNTRGGLVLEWAPGEGPRFGKNQTLGIEGAPGSATAANLEIALEWEE